MGWMGIQGAVVALALAFPCPIAGSPHPTAASGVRIKAPFTRDAVSRAVRGASRRLAEPACAQVLSDFTDASGRPLQRRIETLGMTAQSYLANLTFRDGSNQQACRAKRIRAATMVGSQVVFVCPAFIEAQIRDPRLGDAIVIHEMLHSLGLGENPPRSHEITATVTRRCTP